MKIVKNNDEILNYTGNFGTFSKEGETIKYSETRGDYVELNFTGTKVRFYTHTNAWRGITNIYIDDIKIDAIDTYSQEEIMDVLVYESEELSYGSHTIKIEISGEKNEKSNAAKIAIYRFEIDDEKPSEGETNLDLTELKAIVEELKSIMEE